MPCFNNVSSSPHRLHKSPAPAIWRGSLVLEAGRQVASGLCALHAAGYVHADVKPANIMLGRPHIDGRDHAFPRLVDGGVKVVDFGLARPVDSQGALMGARVGYVGTWVECCCCCCCCCGCCGCCCCY